MAGTVGNSNWLARPPVRRPLSHKVYTLGNCPLGDHKLLPIGTMSKSAAVEAEKEIMKRRVFRPVAIGEFGKDVV